MTRGLVVVVVSTVIAVSGCAGVHARATGAAPDPRGTSSRSGEVTEQIAIYSAAIRRLVTDDHTFGRGAPPFAHVYVVDGPLPGAARIGGQSLTYVLVGDGGHWEIVGRTGPAGIS